MKIRRIQPSKHNFYVFEGESIKVACEVSSQNVIKTIKWSFSLSSLSEDQPLANSTHTTIRNKWDSSEYASPVPRCPILLEATVNYLSSLFCLLTFVIQLENLTSHLILAARWEQISL